MNTNYTSPQMEVVELELENILCQSGDDDRSIDSTIQGLDI